MKVGNPDLDPSFGLIGKVALISGAAQGIGRAIAAVYAERGAQLALVDVSESVCDAAGAIEAGGGDALALVADLTAHGSIAHVVDEVLARYGRIDILVNNAGVALLDEAEHLSEQWWDKTIRLNLTVPFLLSQCAARAMIAAHSGKIINIASQEYCRPDRHVACAAKQALSA
jgi:2-deoxy-D-gluconate 3-dehydrogenase